MTNASHKNDEHVLYEEKKGKWDTLDGILNEIWTMLRRGSTRFNDPFHWPVLGTTGKDGCSLCTVIMRRLILPDRILVCHTDARAAKAREISNDDKVRRLFYHPKKKVQLRISGQAKLHTDDQLAEDQRARTRMTSRLDYCATQHPGTHVDKPSSGLPDFLLNKIPTLFAGHVISCVY